jgi:hypothetical protein
MPRMICPYCQCEYRMETAGVNVIEMAAFGPYRIWRADMWACPGCGQRIIAGFSAKAHEHYEPDFREIYQRIIDSDEPVFYDFERPLPIEPSSDIEISDIDRDPLDLPFG